MKRFLYSLLAALAGMLPRGAAAAAEPAYTLPRLDWKPLFNGRDFTGWDKFLGADGVPNADPANVFTITNVDGGGAVHVSGEIVGAITTQQQFTNFHFRVQFKWGLGRFGGRAKVGRDTGILYCGVGQPNPGTGWLTSVENNVMEKGTGQWWSVNGAIIDCEGEWITDANELSIPYKREGKGEKNIVWRKGGPRLTASSGNGITSPFDVEEVFGNWNTVEVVFWGGQCIHILNGHVNLVAFNPRYQDGGQWRVLDHGKIQLQSEWGEAFYRNAEIRPLYELPREYLDYTVSPVGDEAGFVPLFSAAALPDWKQCGPGGFAVTHGVATGEGGMGLWWYSGRQFTNFVLRGEFLQGQELSDSGVFLRFPDPGDDVWSAVKHGHEMEIGDPNPGNPYAPTGSIYPFASSIANASRPVGEWNQYEIVASGHNYSVRLNGRLVTTWTDTTGRTLGGFIGLQNYKDGKTVRHRNLRVKEIL
jgi:Domain of Unknown Function (DUF1080)